jgi:hypothetical protein
MRHIEGSNAVFYLPGFIARNEERELRRRFDSMPIAGERGHDPRSSFAFTHVFVDGREVQGRLEACAGWPIWYEAGAARGQELTPELAVMAARVRASVRDAFGDADFTSVYVDKYPVGGSFVPHVDRDIYGPVVAGVSVGSGTAELCFSDETNREREVVLKLEPRSLYAFGQSLRRHPWRHEIRDVSDVRYGVTFRSPDLPHSAYTSRSMR